MYMPEHEKYIKHGDFTQLADTTVSITKLLFFKKTAYATNKKPTQVLFSLANHHILAPIYVDICNRYTVNIC